MSDIVIKYLVYQALLGPQAFWSFLKLNVAINSSPCAIARIDANYIKLFRLFK